jgi:hypothetical protein
MTRMRADAFGRCRTPDGRTIPCNPPSGDGLAQLALMLRGSGWLDRNYAASGDAMTDSYQPQSANPSGPAYENSWAAMPDYFGLFNAGSHLPITKAQATLLPSLAEPWIETFPMYEPRPWLENPPMPGEFLPPPALPLEGDDGKHGPKPTEEDCDKEWAEAGRICNEKRKQEAARGNYNFDPFRCAAGMVSDACGGNSVDWGPPRKKFKRYRLHTEIQA